MRAEVNVSIELQFPMVKSKGQGEKTSGAEVNSIFPSTGFHDLGY